MIPILYNGSETDFTHNGLGLLTDVDSNAIYVERERNVNQLLVMKYPENGAKVESLVTGNIIKVDASPKMKGQLFRIYYVKKDIKDMILVYAKHIFFDTKHDTLFQAINEPFNCVGALNKLKMNCIFSLKKFNMESDLTTITPFIQDERNVLDCIMGQENSILTNYGNDPDLVIDNFNIKVTQQGGVDSGVLIAYTKNLDGFSVEEDRDDLVTGIIPYVSHNSGEETIYVKGDLVWSDKKGNYAHPYVISKNFTDYFVDRETNQFRIPSVAELNKVAKDYIINTRCDIPKMTYTISFVPLAKTEEYKDIAAIEELDLLDRAIIHNYKYDIRDQAKIIKTKYNPVKEIFTSMTLGDPRSTLQGIFNTSNNKLDNISNKVENIVTGGLPPKYPDTLPNTPVLKVETSGLKTIALSWTFDNKLHYTYRLYANKQKDFTPTIFDLVFEGQASTYLHEVDYNQIWYYKVEAINTYGRSTGPSNQVMGATAKLSDAATIFEEAAIGDALIANLRADRAWIGQFQAENINFKNAQCLDGNGQQTFSIDSFGRVRISATDFILQGKTIDTIVDEKTATTVKSVNPMFYLSTSATELMGGTWVDIAPPWTNGKYMWTKTVTTLGDNSTRETQPTCISGAIGPQGKPGLDGADGVSGKDGVSLVYKGEFTSHPLNPQDGWYYRNSAQKRTFVYQSGAWYQMTIDGQDGVDGSSIEYKGELDNPPANPQKNWTYKDKQNGILYIYNGSAWVVMVRDGNDGQDGAPGANGLSVFCTYHDGITKPATPTGNGTTNGWHTNWTSSVVWLSQKVSSDVSTGTWGEPIKVAGEDGISVSSVIEQFFLSDSKVNQPAESDSGWVDTCPIWQAGKYIWTRVKIILSDGTVKYTGYNVDTTWEAVNDLEIGGRNIVKDTGTPKSIVSAGATNITGARYDLTVPYLTDIKDKELIVVFDWKYEGENPSGTFYMQTGEPQYDMVTSRESISPTNISGTIKKIWKPTMEKDTKIVYMRTDNMVGTLTISNLRIYFGTRDIGWTPAPEDIQEQIDANKTEISTTKKKMSSLETNLDQISLKVSSVEKTTTSVGDRVTDIETWKKDADLKISDSAIVLTVTKSSTYQNDLNDKVSHNNIISSINQTAEEILIEASKINLKGYVTLTSLNTPGQTVIDGGNLKAGTVVSDKIAIGDFNNYVVIPTNATFTGTSGMTEGYEICSIQGSEKYNHANISNKLYGINGGDMFRVKAMIKSDTAGSRIDITCCWRNANNEIVASNTIYGTVSAANTWTEINEIITVPSRPSGASYVRFKINIQAEQSRRVYIERFNITRMYSGDLIVDGAVTAIKLAADAIDGRLIKGVTIVGGEIRGSSNFFTSPDSNSVDGYAFRIYSSGELHSNNFILTSSGDNYSRLMPDGTISCSKQVNAPAVITGGQSLWLGIRGVTPGSESNFNIELTQQADKNVYLRPGYNGQTSLGHPAKMFHTAYVKNGISSSSDRRLKENLRYVGRDSSTITPQMLFDFIMEDYILAQYNYIDDPQREKISAVAQDLLTTKDGQESKVGQLVINNQEVLQDKVAGYESYLALNQTQLLNIFIGAFQQFVRDTNKRLDALTI